jgi:hypothetical protein
VEVAMRQAGALSFVRLRVLSLAAVMLFAGFPTGAAPSAQRTMLPAGGAATLDTSGTWVLLSDLHAPPALALPVGVFDPVRDRLLVLEGAYATGWPAVHALDLQPAPRWSELPMDGPPPVGRIGPAVAYDPVRDRLLLFGGAGYSDLWALTFLPSPAWQALVTTGETPRTRAGHSAVYDPIRDRMVIFGGIDGSTYLGDSWAISLRTNQWEHLASAGAGPSSRAWHRAVYDSVGDRMIVVGGQDSAGYTSDVWALPLESGGEWTALAPEGPSPSPRSRFGMVYDARRTRVLVHGGLTATGFAGDMWALDLTAPPRWEAVATLNSLDPRADQLMVADPAEDRVLSYGGHAAGGTWEQTASMPLGGPLCWSRFLPPSPPTLPGPRTGQVTLYDSRRGRLLVLGGSYRPTDIGCWAFTPTDDPVWTPLPVPAPMPAGPAVYDSIADQVIVFSGAGTWSLSLDTYEWRLLDTSGRQYLQLATYTFDPVRHRVIVCGGADAMDPCRCVLRDVYAFRLDGTPGWERIGGCPHPQGMAGHSAFYDPLDDRLVVLGGWWQNGTTIHYGFGSEWWATPLGGDSLVWSPLYASNAEPPAGQSVYDAIRHRLLRFSDYGTLGVWEVWSRSVADSVPWTPLARVGAGPLAEAPIVFDPVHDRVVMAFTAPAATVPVPPDQVWAMFFGSFEITWQVTTAAWDGVEVVWRSSLARGLSAMLQRHDESAGRWFDLAEFDFDDSGLLRADDATVHPGTRYCYRLAMTNGTTSTFSDPVWVDVPPAPTLTFAGARPNPSRYGLRVVFSLPDASSARLDVIDVSGRRILSREVGGLGPGLHALDLAEGHPLAPGLYLLRLSHGSEWRSARAVVIH